MFNEIIGGLGFRPDNLPERYRDILKELGASDKLLGTRSFVCEDPALVYMTYTDWEAHKKVEQKNLPVKVPKNEFILTSSKFVNRASLQGQKVNPNTAILCLAACGLDLMLPNLSFDLVADEEIERLKELLYEERVDYLNSITRIADETYDRIQTGKLSDIMFWAESEVTFKLLPKARILEKQTPKVSKKTLSKAAYQFWTDGVPAIGKAYFEDGTGRAVKVSTENLLRFLSEVIIREDKLRDLPEVSYAMKLSQNLNNS